MISLTNRIFLIVIICFSVIFDWFIEKIYPLFLKLEDSWIVTFDLYLFQLTVLLKPDLNCCNRFALSSDKLQLEHKVFAFVSLDNKVFPDQVKKRLISQLIKSILRVLAKSLVQLFQHFSVISSKCFTWFFLFKFKQRTVAI